MPNWVYNNVTISGEVAEVSKLITDMARSVPAEDGTLTETHFSFWNVVNPTDEELVDYWSTTWYDWRLQNWGCKWDASDVVTDRNSDGSVQYAFETPWSPPLPIYEKLAEQYPTLNFEWSYEEEQGWGGTMSYEAGGLSGRTDYDIPESHQDFVDRSNEGACYCAESDDPDDIFDDCPKNILNQDDKGTLISVPALSI